MNPQNDLIKQGETVVQSDPNNAWVIVDAGTRRFMRTRATNGQIGEQEIPQTQTQNMSQTGITAAGTYQPTGATKIIGEVAAASAVVGSATAAITTLKGLFGKK